MYIYINVSDIIVPLQMKADLREEGFLFRRHRLDLQANTQPSYFPKDIPYFSKQARRGYSRRDHCTPIPFGLIE